MNMNSRRPHAFLAGIVCVCLYSAGLSFSLGGFKMDDFRDSLLPSFHRKFLSFVKDALQNDAVADLFLQNLHRGTGRRQLARNGGGTPAAAHAKMSTNDVKELLNKYKVKVDRKYSDALQALTRLKEEFEKNLVRSAGSPLSGRLLECCEYKRNVPLRARTSPVYRYEARYRDEVNLSQVCVGKTADTAHSPFGLRAEDAFRVMKSNYENQSSILWQYVATLDGHYVQFPAKNRSCDDSGHPVSPLNQRWMVDKLLQQKLNLVILLDAGEEMNSFTSSSSSSSPGAPPVTHLSMAKHAARIVLNQLAFVDRVSVVVLNGSSSTPPGCSQRLLVASQRNVDLLSTFVDGVTVAAQPDPGLEEGFQTAYRLLHAEKEAVEGKKDTNDVIMLLTNGEYVVLKEKELLANIKSGQDSLDHSVTHLVYLIQAGSLTPALDTLVKVADLNNLKLVNATPWTGVGGPVGPVGQLQKVPASARFQYAESVAEFYRLFPRGAVGGMDRISAVSPHRDPKVGLLLTFAIPVYNGTQDLSSLHGVAAIDVSMASLLDDVIHFRWQRKSYSFVVERERGLVLVHPKLDSPARMTDWDPVFSSMEFVEPTLTLRQRGQILAAPDDAVIVFDAEVLPGRTTYKTGLDSSDVQTSSAKIACSRLPDSDYVLVMVIFEDELTPDTVASADDVSSLGFKGLALYHHLLIVNNTAHDGVCASSGDVRVKDRLTVKFSPEVFTEPEMYINNEEAAEEVATMTDFLTQDAPPPPVIRPDILSYVLRDLRVVSSLRLSRLWTQAFSHGVVERFIGTPSGIFAAYPGISLPNVFDGKQYAWYRESMAEPDKVRVTLHRSFATPDRRVMLSTALGDSQGLFGVVGAAVSRRSFAGLFFNTVPLCLEAEYSCHLLTENGYLLDVLDERTPPGTRRHLTSVYPWLANNLLQRRVMKPVWCTTLSKGQHSLTYVLHVHTADVTHEAHVRDTCRQFLLFPVEGFNLLVLVLVGRQREGCRESVSPFESCSSCQRRPGMSRCSKCLTAAPSSLPTSPNTSGPLSPSPSFLCQCPCSCDVDFNRCQDSFRFRQGDNFLPFPFTSCYEEPALPSVTSHKWIDESSSSAIPPCGQLCPSFEKKEGCETVVHCQWKDSERYPECRAHVTTTSTPATTPQTSPTFTRTESESGGPLGHASSTTRLPSFNRPEKETDGLGGGAIAGIVVGVATVLAVGFLIGYYKLLKPRLFTRLMESESVAEADGSSSSGAHYNSQNDALELPVPPVTPSDISAAPWATTVQSSRTC